MNRWWLCVDIDHPWCGAGRYNGWYRRRNVPL